MGFVLSNWANRLVVAGLLFITWIFLIAALAATEWGTASNFHAGLWRVCNFGACGDIDTSNCNNNDCNELRAARGFLVIAVILESFALIFALLQCFLVNLKDIIIGIQL